MPGSQRIWLNSDFTLECKGWIIRQLQNRCFFFNRLVIAHNQQILQGGLNENFRSNSLRVSKLRLAGKTTKISCSSSAGKFINYKKNIYICSLLSTLKRTNENVPSECWEFLIGDSVHLYLGIENKFYSVKYRTVCGTLNYYLSKMRGYLPFSFWIPTALAQICFSCIVINRTKIHLY